MTFSPLLCHSADILAGSHRVSAGRDTVVWTVVATIPCRFTRPQTAIARPAEGAIIDTVDARVYTGPELEPLVKRYRLPLRFSTENEGWTGTYELRTMPEWYTADSLRIHHGECDVTKVV
ncbi:MAG TPA: hypothetical protein O0X27_04145 [Methanocorpusculum sp.]|nr:hypothetical protein [Methanocorpusculum sp.]